MEHNDGMMTVDSDLVKHNNMIRNCNPTELYHRSQDGKIKRLKISLTASSPLAENIRLSC